MPGSSQPLKTVGVQFWEARMAIVQCMLQGHRNSVISIDLSPAGNVLATGSGGWEARICELFFFFLFVCFRERVDAVFCPLNREL